MVFCILGVDLRNDQRHLTVEAERGGVIHKNRTGLDNGGGELLGNVVFRGAEDDVQTLERLVAGFLNHDGLALPFDDLARTALAGQKM